MSSFESIQSLIHDFSKGSPLGHKLSEGHLRQTWETIVGSTMAKHSYPESIRYKKLFLVADNSVWLQQLVFLKSAILEAVHSIMPELSLTDVVLRIGTLPPAASRPAPTSSSATECVAEPSPFATDLTRRLSNPELQTLLSQTITKALAEPPASIKDSSKTSFPRKPAPPTPPETPTAS